MKEPRASEQLAITINMMSFSTFRITSVHLTPQGLLDWGFVKQRNENMENEFVAWVKSLWTELEKAVLIQSLMICCTVHIICLFVVMG